MAGDPRRPAILGRRRRVLRVPGPEHVPRVPLYLPGRRPALPLARPAFHLLGRVHGHDPREHRAALPVFHALAWIRGRGPRRFESGTIILMAAPQVSPGYHGPSPRPR